MASTVRGFFSPSILKFASDEIRTQDLLGARRYRAGLANSTARPFAFNISTTASVSNRIIIDLFLFRIDHKVMVFFLYLCSYPLDHLVMIKISKEHQKPPLKHAPFSLYFSREIKIGKATDIFICQAKNSLGGISILSVSFQVC